MSLFAFAVGSSGWGPTLCDKCIVILDGLEHIVGSAHGGRGDGGKGLSAADGDESHLLTRMRSTFLALVDSLRGSTSRSPGGGVRIDRELLVVCTAGGVHDGIFGRFDNVFFLAPPTAEERAQIISSSLRLEDYGRGSPLVTPPEDPLSVRGLLYDVVDCTAGRSRAEVAHCCREAILLASRSDDLTVARESMDGNDDFVSDRPLSVLRAMKHSLQTFAPESVRGGSLDGVVDAKVLTSKELAAFTDGGPDEVRLPLFGRQAEDAWKQLEALIVAPLCRSRELDELLYGTTGPNRSVGGGGFASGGKVVCSGALLSGPPGSGKSSLALHCAAVASRLVPTVRLLDVCCTSLVHKEVGASERAVQRLFACARAAAPCILLMDGIENVAPLRGHDNTTEGTMDRLLSTLLTEMDGIDEGYGSDEASPAGSGRVAVIGVTHNPLSIDPALRRPGRLEKCIVLDRPDLEARRAIVMKEVERLPIDFSDAKVFEPKTCNDLAQSVAMQSNGMSAAEVIALCTEASMISVRECINSGNADSDMMSFKPVLQYRHFVSALHFRRTGTTESF